jgi:hypothetical protein
MANFHLVRRSSATRVEQGIMKVYDRSSPITKPFAEKDLTFKEAGRLSVLSRFRGYAGL